MADRYVVSVLVADRVGILRDITGALADMGARIDGISQTVEAGYFTVILTASFDDKVSMEEIRNSIVQNFSADEAAVVQEGGEPEWVSQWEPTFGSGGLPVAIRLYVTAADDRGDGQAFTLERTLRLPVKDVARETLDTALKESLNL